VGTPWGGLRLLRWGTAVKHGRIEIAAAVPEAEGRRLATGRVSECDGTSQGARGWLRGGGGAGVGARDASWHLRVGIFASPW